MNSHRVSLILFAVVVALCAWTFWPREKPAVGESRALPPASEVRTVEKVVYRPKLIYVYPDKSKNGLNLPKSLSEDPSKKLIATGKLDAEERPYTLSTVLDTATGESEVYARPDPLPWIGPGRQGKAGIAYGLKDGQRIGRLYASHDLVQVKALHAGGMASLDTDGQWFAGGYVELRF